MNSQPHYHRAVVKSAANDKTLAGIRRGIEKEGLRVSKDHGMLAQTPHPKSLGAALTHELITTDYSESLLEFITPPSTDISENLQVLSKIHRYTASMLDGELIWGASMPCIVTGDRGIPIAHYGSSCIGQMKRVYRNGLGARYGRMMQAIAGIHYNFSMPDSFWTQAWSEAGGIGKLQEFKTEGYLGLIRNFFNRVWLLIYLMGASPAVCASFLSGNRNHHLVPVDETASSLYLPYATSLRMGDLGYNSEAQKGIQICYNSLDNYIKALHEAILTPHPDYGDIHLTDDGERAQLSNSLLQIENEFYSPIRPKRVSRSGEAPIAALARGGIEYIEVRCVDINPFLPLGIDEQTMRLLDVFLVDCLLSDSPLCDEAGQRRNTENLRRVVDCGRDPDLMLHDGDKEIAFSVLAEQLLNQMADTAALLDRDHGGTGHTDAIKMARGRLADPDSTPSGRILTEMREQKMPFWQLALNYSRHWDKQFRSEVLSDEEQQYFAQLAVESIDKQKLLEADDSVSFDSYLTQFFAQYQELAP